MASCLDEFVDTAAYPILSDEDSERFKEILEIKIEEALEQSQYQHRNTALTEKEARQAAGGYCSPDQEICVRQTEASNAVTFKGDIARPWLRNCGRRSSMLVQTGRRQKEQYGCRPRLWNMTKERLLSFAEYAKDAQPEVLVTLIQTIVERIYIVDKDDERFCHIFIKGCTDEDYTGFFQTAGYIEQNTTPVCDSEQYCI